jgi:hypothetical protein
MAQCRSRNQRAEAGATPTKQMTHRASFGGVAPALDWFGPCILLPSFRESCLTICSASIHRAVEEGGEEPREVPA